MNVAPPVIPKKSSALKIVLVILGTLFVLFVVLGGFAAYGVRKYIANAKTAEAKNSVSFMAKYAAEHYENASPHALCASASAPVPADPGQVRGTKYQAQPGEWQKDAARNAGFACLKFETTFPQYYQYDYKATATGFTVTAHGDLDGDGKLSTFELTGQVVDGQVVIAPAIREVDPEE